jgi:hypothetical protein
LWRSITFPTKGLRCNTICEQLISIRRRKAALSPSSGVGMARKSAKKKDFAEGAATTPTEPSQSLPPQPPTVFAAVLGDGGRVRRVGNALTEAQAVAERQAGKDVVVCGNELSANRNLAKSIELQACGDYEVHQPHANAGPYALPHCQPKTRPPEGHTFYETKNLKSSK